MKITSGMFGLPGTSRTNLTGEWRVNIPVYLQERCTGCQLCDLLCPEGIVFGEGKVYWCDYDYCKGCGICAEVCPVHDIEMRLEDK